MFVRVPCYKKNIMSNQINDPNTTFVDVRSAWEYDEEHIENALNIPLEELNGNIEKLKSLKGSIVFYCRSGNRSGVGVILAKNAGLTNVSNGGSLYELSKQITSHV